MVLDRAGLSLWGALILAGAPKDPCVKSTLPSYLLANNNLLKLCRTFSWLWLAVNDDYRMICCSDYSMVSGCPALAALRLQQCCLIKKNLLSDWSNNTGRNSTEFWFIIFKTWSFLWGTGGPLMWGPWGTCPKCPLVNPALVLLWLQAAIYFLLQITST